MFDYVLLLFPIALVLGGLVFLLIQLFRMVFCNESSIKDNSYDCLTGDPNRIKEVSMKYGHRIRGSVRLSQGRIKSLEEMHSKEKNIIFP